MYIFVIGAPFKVFVQIAIPVLSCLPPPDVPHAHTSYTSLSLWSPASYTCHPGFEFPEGGTLRTVLCLPSLSWHVPVTGCTGLVLYGCISSIYYLLASYAFSYMSFAVLELVNGCSTISTLQPSHVKVLQDLTHRRQQGSNTVL